MHKQKAIEKCGNLDKRKIFWNQVVEDIDQKLAEAKQRVSELESAKTIFKRNATTGAPIPGQEATVATRN